MRCVVCIALRLLQLLSGPFWVPQVPDDKGFADFSPESTRWVGWVGRACCFLPMVVGFGISWSTRGFELDVCECVDSQVAIVGLAIGSRSCRSVLERDDMSEAQASKILSIRNGRSCCLGLKNMLTWSAHGPSLPNSQLSVWLPVSVSPFKMPEVPQETSTTKATTGISYLDPEIPTESCTPG